ncbi:hypothetical protein D3C85_13800 [compost metagenome]
MNNILDSDWVKSAFLLPADTTIGGNETIVNRIYSNSMQQAGDTTPGGCFIINPLAQFTRYADLKHNVYGNGTDSNGQNILIPRVSRINKTSPTSGNGMGRIYHEKFIENTQVVHFRCGLPEFNTMTSFYANYYSVPAASMARTGRAPGFFYNLGWALGSIVTIPLMPFVFAGKVIRFFLRRPASKYYYLKPTMYPYWTAVSSMVNGIAANMGVIPRPIYEGSKHLYNKEDGLDNEDIIGYHKLIPTIYRENGGLDVFAIAQRGQRLANARHAILRGKLKKESDPDKIKNIFKRYLYGQDLGRVYTELNNTTQPTLKAYADLWMNNSRMGKMEVEEAASNTENVERTIRGDEGSESHGAYIDALLAEARMGSDFVSFRVDYTGTQSESFNNATKEPSIQGQINGISASARETRFALFDGAITGAAGMAVDAMKSFVAGGLQGMGIQGLAQLSGSAFVDIPKVWDSSSCDFNKLSLTIPLRSPYGDPVSRLQNLILPMCCLFAMGVPLATGKQSHTSPFLIEYFAQGRAHSRLAMIDSLSFTRGVGDVGWNNVGGFLGVDVTVGLIDLSNAINMPINPSFEFGEAVIQAAGYGIGGTGSFLGGGDFSAGGTAGSAVAQAMLGSTYDDDNNYTDYLSILAGLPLEAEINMARKWAVRLARKQAAMDDMTSPNRIAMWTMDSVPGELARILATSTERQ